MINIQIEHPFLLIFGFVLSILVAFVFYYKDKKFNHLPKKLIYFLAFLRFFALFMLFLLLSNPLLQRTIKVKQKPILVFLLDNSRSIPLAIDSTKLAKYTNLIMKQVSSLNQKFDIKIFTFSDSILNQNKWNFTGNFTNISLALNDIEQMFINQNLGAIVLVSDGIYNRGTNPEILAHNYPYPVYSILLGDTTEYKDLQISNIRTNPIVYVHEKFPIQVEIKAKNLAQKNITLSIQINNNTLAQKNVFIDKKYFTHKTTFYIKSPAVGKILIKAKITALPEEKNILNNSKTAIINVIDSRQKILILSNFPHPDIATIRRSLSNIPTYKIDYHNYNKFSGQYSDYDLIILYQLPGEKTNLSKLKNFFESGSKPILFICGLKCDIIKLKQLNLGLNFTPIPGTKDQAQGVLNKEFDIFSINQELDKILQNLPPLIVPYLDFEQISQNNILLYQKINDITTHKPLIMFLPTSPINNNKLGIIWGEGLWRWRMNIFRNTKTFKVFDELIQQIIQFLIINEDKKRFKVKVNPIIEQNQEVKFTAYLYDLTYNPITQAQVKLFLKDSSGRVLKYIFEQYLDNYHLNIGKLPQGVYTYHATAQWKDKEFTEKGSFVVRSNNIEALNLQAKKDLLEKISAYTGAKLFFSDQIKQLADSLIINEQINTLVYTKEDIKQIIEFPFLIFLIVFILGLEWFLRKFYGNL